jgi:hypothetical protein
MKLHGRSSGDNLDTLRENTPGEILHAIWNYFNR